MFVILTLLTVTGVLGAFFFGGGGKKFFLPKLIPFKGSWSHNLGSKSKPFVHFVLLLCCVVEAKGVMRMSSWWLLQQHYSNSCWQDSAPLRFYELQPRLGALLTSSSLLVVTAIVTLSPLPCQTYQLTTTNYFLSMTTPLPQLNIILRWEFSSALHQHLRSFHNLGEDLIHKGLDGIDSSNHL